MHGAVEQAQRGRAAPAAGRQPGRAAAPPPQALLLSSPDVGSSRNSSAGRVSSSTATHSRLRSPPLMPLRRGLPTRVCLRQGVVVVVCVCGGGGARGGGAGGGRLLGAARAGLSPAARDRCGMQPLPPAGTTPQAASRVSPAVGKTTRLDHFLDARHPLLHAGAGRQAQLAMREEERGGGSRKGGAVRGERGGRRSWRWGEEGWKQAADNG